MDTKEYWVDVRPLERGEIENMLGIKLEDWQWVRIAPYVRYREAPEEEAPQSQKKGRMEGQQVKLATVDEITTWPDVIRNDPKLMTIVEEAPSDAKDDSD